MEALGKFNLTTENTTLLRTGAFTDKACYNVDSRFFATGDFLEYYIANLIFNIILAIVTTLENLVILIAIWRKPTLQVPSNILLFFLALSDLGVGLFAQPFIVVYTAAKLQGFISMACVSLQVAAVLSTYLCGISLLSITAVSIDRYLALYLHLRYKQLVTNKRVIKALVCTWLSAGLALVPWIWYPKVISNITVAVGLGCIFVTTYCFCRIYFILRHHQRQIFLQSETERSFRTPNRTPISKRYKLSVLGMFTVYILLLLFYIPYICIAVVIVVQGTTISNRLLFELMRTVVSANSAINPLIYCWRLRDIREAVLDLFPWF